ncbi:hypothetical protein AMTR_s00018p00035270 [Amborella trichopoda]|uniref:Uncharacterized protein n=1 Tax=Amborella trichopoda TaxID=13333 RepID=W1PDT3_AMBTC|nr:hypothetical protein AMTR_s00018p00035270 [Amborella trichopoda]
METHLLQPPLCYTGTSSEATHLSPSPFCNIPIICSLESPLDEVGQPALQLSSFPSTLPQVPSPTLSPIQLTPSPPPPPSFSATPQPFPPSIPTSFLHPQQPKPL